MAVDAPRPIRRAGIRQVADLAGVSESTVSNVLNNPHIVAPATRERVERAMNDVGFVRNRAARQLRGAPSSVIGCVLLDTANTFFAEVARGIEDRLAEADCMHLLCSSDVQPERERRYLHMLEEHGVRGIIVNPVRQDLTPLIELSRRGVPVVLLDHPPDGAPLCAVTVDNALGGQRAAEHLLALGHTRIAFLRTAEAVNATVQRQAGARHACLTAGLDPDGALIDLPVSRPTSSGATEAAVTQLLHQDPRPTAIICFNDVAAVRVLRGLRRAGIRVPEDMSVVGYDDVDFASELSPALTTVRQPRHELGRAAVDLLLAEHDHGHTHRELVFRPDLILRQSTAPPRPA
ncbi:LacI family DNA-binding transcriptional regulator [Luedemannella flava]|uniref:LacI family DNA-binding transcriptional regulator n=1 Tax=Luedemannella flava TaxID=349316 RepID=A0ABP4XS94_9ACTN